MHRERIRRRRRNLRRERASAILRDAVERLSGRSSYGATLRFIRKSLRGALQPFVGKTVARDSVSSVEIKGSVVTAMLKVPVHADRITINFTLDKEASGVD